MIKIDFWELIKNSLPLFWSFFWKFWPVWAIILIFVAIRLFFDWLDFEIKNWSIRRKFKKGEQWRTDRELIQWLRAMRPAEFEIYVADLFRRLGYQTKRVGGSHDGGIDVIAEKDGKKHYIQCKKYFSKHEVGSPDVRNFYGAIADRLSNGEGWFITTNKFTPEAEIFAEDKPIILIDQFKLVEYIKRAEKEGFNSRSRIEQNLKCPKCDSTLIERNGKFGNFYGCANYPKCDYTTSGKI